MNQSRDKQILNWRIDAEIKKYSHWKVLITILWLFVLLSLTLLASLLWWQLLLMLLVLLSSFYFCQLQVQNVVHITQPLAVAINQSNRKSCWFVYIASAGNKKTLIKEQLWQCHLSSVYSNNYVIILYFDVVSPYIRKLPVSIWRDQLEPNEWRKLTVLAKFF